LPGSAGTIIGDDTVCSNNESYTYTVPAIAGATSYTWSVPRGTAITSGAGTNSVIITISPEAISGAITVQGKNTCGSGPAGVKNIIVKICAGISENITETGISVYPNPAEGVINMIITNGENQIDLQIIDIRGQIVYKELLDNIPHEFTHKVDVSALSRGVYFVEMVNSKRFMIKKIILQ
jgi:hypothetical protein